MLAAGMKAILGITAKIFPSSGASFISEHDLSGIFAFAQPFMDIIDLSGLDASLGGTAVATFAIYYFFIGN